MALTAIPLGSPHAPLGAARPCEPDRSLRHTTRRTKRRGPTVSARRARVTFLQTARPPTHCHGSDRWGCMMPWPCLAPISAGSGVTGCERLVTSSGLSESPAEGLEPIEGGAERSLGDLGRA